MDRDFIEAAARFKRELYGEYGSFYYVPMAESRAVLTTLPDFGFISSSRILPF